ncbi:hypothetical protein J2S40_004450 [Nocardioides luteus]|uniref:DUF4229 domain-containing protein n=1 Tax=Nocardioides luteus TaxID=1844 RepID=A0ABQ5SSC9_9ACTN|nr:DUF4229 domain-containing protein [Nocardioides luteus]MDR7313392.1 hypothetical protein [Nocardioides luteus]GGR60640.1 hypothetical protein GCM10010197_29570 [Nocardioides luteus]GLJ66458.1 hypothetical protein GCM10017579_04940 [Nocardioides luteus]
MKEFWIYTGLRLLSLVATFGIVAGIWSLVAGEVNLFFAIILAFVISGILSFFVLDPQRRAFAEKVEARAARAVEAARAKEDDEIDSSVDTASSGEGDGHKVS